MQCGAWQARVWGLVLVLASSAVAVERGPFARQLARECDALIQAAVQRPYGWGWDTVAPASAAGRNAPRHVTLEPLGTPAAGLLLLWSGQLLGEPRYTQAAMDAARGIAAAQNSTGKIPQRAIFGATAGGRDAPELVPERAATRASLALLLALIEHDASGGERLAGPAQRAAIWLSRQQADDGGWIVGYPPDAAPRQAQRLLRLDEAEYRDCTYAMLLASQTIKNPVMARSVSRAGEKLLSLRLATRLDLPRDATPQRVELARHAVHLWSTAYLPNGTIDDKMSEFPIMADVVASKYAMQTLLGIYLVTGDKPSAAAIDSAAQAIVDLRANDPSWRRGYLVGATTAPSTQSAGSTFEPPPPPAVHDLPGLYGLQPTLDAVQQLRLLGRDKYLAMLSANLTLRQHLAGTVCGLTDDPLTLDLPVARDEVQPYLRRTAERWESLSGPIPDDLGARVHRLWLLWVRARLELLESPR